MQHSYIDKYAGLDSFVHRIDAKAKIAIFSAFILLIALTGPAAYPYFILYGALLFFAALVSKVPFSFLFKRSLTVIPFVILIALFIPFIKGEEGVVLFWSIVIKSYLSVLFLILLTSTTKFTSLLKGFERLRVPKVFIMIISFMYRYIFLIVDEVQRMERAKESRSFANTGCLRAVRTLSNIAGVIFVRSYERAERVYIAMCSRGFDGEIKTLEG